jgi:hypothetical protein
MNQATDTMNTTAAKPELSEGQLLILKFHYGEATEDEKCELIRMMFRDRKLRHEYMELHLLGRRPQPRPDDA